MEINNNKVGFAVGLTGGAALGATIGAQKAKNIKAPFTEVLKYGSQDEFVKQKVFGDKITEIINSPSHDPSKHIDFMKAVKAEGDAVKKEYKVLTAKLPKALKKAKIAKTRWTVGLAATGAALGLGIAIANTQAKKIKGVYAEKSAVWKENSAKKAQAKQEAIAAKKAAKAEKHHKFAKVG